MAIILTSFKCHNDAGFLAASALATFNISGRGHKELVLSKSPALPEPPCQTPAVTVGQSAGEGPGRLRLRVSADNIGKVL